MTMTTLIHYHKYRILNVYGKTDEAAREKIIACWHRNKLFLKMPSVKLERRARQVVYMVLNRQEQVVGVSTVFIAKLPRDGQSYFFYRMFIQPPDRIYGMMKLLTIESCKFLADTPQSDQTMGVIIFTENKKLMRPGLKRMFQKNHFEYLGKNPKNQDVWRWAFSGSEQNGVP